MGVKRGKTGSIFANGNYETPSVSNRDYPVGTYIKLGQPSDYPSYGDWYALQPGTYYCLEDSGYSHRKVVLTSANTFPYNLRISSVLEAQVFVY